MNQEQGYVFLSEYVNARTKVKVRCPQGHEFDILPYDWKRGVRCGVCYRESQRQRFMKQCDTVGNGNLSPSLTSKKPDPKGVLNQEVPIKNTVNNPTIPIVDKYVDKKEQVRTFFAKIVKINKKREEPFTIECLPLTDDDIKRTLIKKVKLCHVQSGEEMTLEVMEEPNIRKNTISIVLSYNIEEDMDCLVKWMDSVYTKDWLNSLA